MSLLIKGMEMPKENDYTIAIVYGDGVVTEYHEDYWIRGADGEKQLGIAVPVPPHGRLIDADELYERAKLRSERFNGCFNDLDNVINALYIETFPTIIPAEEGE